MGLSSDEKANQFYEKRKKKKERKEKKRKEKKKGKKEKIRNIMLSDCPAPPGNNIIWDNTTRNKYNAEKRT